MSTLYNDALKEHGVFNRNLIEDLRLALERRAASLLGCCAGFRNASGALSFAISSSNVVIITTAN
jgi:hypothetical protein